jgi:hypothetical protein
VQRVAQTLAHLRLDGFLHDLPLKGFLADNAAREQFLSHPDADPAAEDGVLRDLQVYLEHLGQGLLVAVVVIIVEHSRQVQTFMTRFIPDIIHLAGISPISGRKKPIHR